MEGIEMVFPLRIREMLTDAAWKTGLEEIRVRIGQPMEFFYDNGVKYMLLQEQTCRFCDRAQFGSADGQLFWIGEKEIAEMLNYISKYSLYAYKEEMKQGFITIEGGHRIGMAGKAVVENGKIAGLHHITFMNIRIAHERRGCASGLLPYIRHQGSIYSTLLFSAPGAGKTTYLRDSIRMLSEGDETAYGMKVCVVDERSEIAACHMGVPQNDLGPRTDVLDGCPKAEGMLMMLRSMSPQVLAVDELGTEKDFMAAEQAVYSGSKVLGTIHAGDMKELSEKPFLRRWMGRKVFRRYVQIERGADGIRKFQVYDENMERVC